MAEEKVLEGKETHIVHVGVIVKDLEKTVEFLTSLGFGPFAWRPINIPMLSSAARRPFGKQEERSPNKGPWSLN